MTLSDLEPYLENYNKCFSKNHIPPYGTLSCWSPKFGHPWGYPPKWEKTCLRCGRTAVQNFTPIGKALAEKSVTVQKRHSKLSILSILSYDGKPISFKLCGMLGIREQTQRFDFCQCHFKVKVIFSDEMTARRETITLGTTPTFPVTKKESCLRRLWRKYCTQLLKSLTVHVKLRMPTVRLDFNRHVKISSSIVLSSPELYITSSW